MNVTYYELSNYNGGTLFPKTFELDGITQEEHMAELSDWLEELTEETGELCEEWIVADTEGVPSQFVGTWGIDSAFWGFVEAVEEHGDEQLVIAALDCDIPLDQIGDAFAMQASSDVEFAEEYIENTGLLADVDESIARYFDIEAYARDLMHDAVEAHGYYFWTNY